MLPQPRAWYEPSAEPVPCDPLALSPHETVLEPPVVMGQMSDGAILILDRLRSFHLRAFIRRAPSQLQEIDAEPRVFESDGSEWSLDFWANDSLFSGGIVRAPKVAGTDGLMPEFSRGSVELQLRDGVAGQPGSTEWLTGVDDCEQELVDLPPTTHWWSVEYLGQSSADGSWLYLIGLDELAGYYSYERYFLFYGPADDVQQRPLTSFNQTRDGRTRFSYEVDGDIVEVDIPGGCEASAITRFCSGAMRIGDEDHQLETRWDEFPDALNDLSFSCQYVIE